MDNAARTLSSQPKLPHHVRFVREFPLTVTGKIQKFAMRAAMIASLETAKRLADT